MEYPSLPNLAGIESSNSRTIDAGISLGHRMKKSLSPTKARGMGGRVRGFATNVGRGLGKSGQWAFVNNHSRYSVVESVCAHSHESVPVGRSIVTCVTARRRAAQP